GRTLHCNPYKSKLPTSDHGLPCHLLAGRSLPSDFESTQEQVALARRTSGRGARDRGADALSPRRSETSHAGHESPDAHGIADVLLSIRPCEVGFLVPHVAPDAERRPDE